MTTSVRLGPDLEDALARAAAAVGETPSEFIRKAVQTRVDFMWTQASAEDPWAEFRDLIGSLSSEHGSDARNSGKVVAEGLAAKADVARAKRRTARQKTAS